ncbi:hypothetical protein [Stappia sp. TSB10P1A]|nr:hypothetical protein [Stappia sp. TSB10P1A]
MSAFISRKAEFDGLLERSTALSAYYFGVSLMMFIDDMSARSRLLCFC